MNFFRFFQSHGFTLVIIGVAITIAVCISKANSQLWNKASEGTQSISTMFDQKK